MNKKEQVSETDETPAVLGKTSSALITGVVATGLANAALTIAKEELPRLKQTMAAVAGHHWLAHAAMLFVLFALVVICSRPAFSRGVSEKRASLAAVLSVGICFALILCYYIFAYAFSAH